MIRLARWALAIATISGAAAASSGPPDFNAYLLPDNSTIEIDQVIDIDFEVDATAVQFNGYEVTIQYDPSVVSFEGVSEGQLMIDACGDRFSTSDTTDSTVTYSHVILCSGVSVNGPGVLSTFQFKGVANGTSPLVITTDPDRAFLDDGLFIWPGHPTFPRQVVLHDAQIVVDDDAIAVGDAGLNPSGIDVRALPNPTRSGAMLQFAGADGPVMITVYDVAGRELRSWGAAETSSESFFDGTDRDGRPLPAGTYYYRVRAGDGASNVGSLRLLPR